MLRGVTIYIHTYLVYIHEQEQYDKHSRLCRQKKLAMAMRVATNIRYWQHIHMSENNLESTLTGILVRIVEARNCSKVVVLNVDWIFKTRDTSRP